MAQRRRAAVAPCSSGHSEPTVDTPEPTLLTPSCSFAITDWDAAYANGASIVDGDSYPARWKTRAAAFRDRLAATGRSELDQVYGPDDRHRVDVFEPSGPPRGVVVVVHGGYWMQTSKSDWSHLAAGVVERGHVAVVPSYPLCPAVTIADITRSVARAVEWAAERGDATLRLVGHSAGGHLVTRMVTASTPLRADVAARIDRVVSISGLHDLRPLCRTTMNDTLGLDAVSAAAESPALDMPLDTVQVTTWVGGAERDELRRQSRLLANIWRGLGLATRFVEEPDRHHFDVVDGLGDADHPLVELLTGE